MRTAQEGKTMLNIIDFIPVGKSNAVHRTELTNRTGLASREVDRVIFEARKNGAVICSATQGYYIPETAEEALQYYAAQQSRIRSGNIALRPVREYIKREGQRKQWEELERIERELNNDR